MANTIIIRKASKNYTCDVCGRIIREGSEYLDRIILYNGKCVQHERYHDECPKTSLAQKLFCKLEQNNYDLIAASNKTGDKIHIIGINCLIKGVMIIFTDWDDNESKTMDLSELKNYHDCNGNDLI